MQGIDQTGYIIYIICVCVYNTMQYNISKYIMHMLVIYIEAVHKTCTIYQ